jgi:putative transposase
MNRSVSQRRAAVKRSNRLSMARQCELLSIHRSGLYYAPKSESELNLQLMQLIDQQFMLRPYYGVPRMTKWLKLDKGFKINHKRIERLYRIMGLQALGPKPNTSRPGKHHKRFPYLIKNLKITRSNQVWAMDITYIPVQNGYLYLCAIIDLQSRYVVNWSLSNTMSSSWCTKTLEQAIDQFGTPEIVNTDQGSQFTSEEFTEYVLNKGIRLSMDGKGRAIDNIFIERLWRSVKYEHVYLKPSEDGIECYNGLQEYFEFYNHHRRHQSLNDQTPKTVYRNSPKVAA